MQKPKLNKKKSQQIEITLMEWICILSAFSGQPIENVKHWKIPFFMKMADAYIRDVELRQVKL